MEKWLQEFYAEYAEFYGCTPAEADAMGWDLEELENDYFKQGVTPVDAAQEEYTAMF